MKQRLKCLLDVCLILSLKLVSKEFTYPASYSSPERHFIVIRNVDNLIIECAVGLTIVQDIVVDKIYSNAGQKYFIIII